MISRQLPDQSHCGLKTAAKKLLPRASKRIDGVTVPGVMTRTTSALTTPLAMRRVFHLLAHGDFMAGVQKFLDIGFRRVIRHAAERHRESSFLFREVKRDIENLGRRMRRLRRTFRKNRRGEKTEWRPDTSP